MSYDGDEIYHVGTPHEGSVPHSGRYGWGTGKNPYQHGYHSFLDRYDDIKRKNPNATKSDIAKMLNVTPKELDSQLDLEKANRKLAYEWDLWTDYKKGMTNKELANKYGKNESSIRSTINRIEDEQAGGKMRKAIVLQETIATLKNAIETKGYVEVGTQVEKETSVGNESEVKRNTFDNAIQQLKNEGYFVSGRRVNRPTDPNSTNKTTITVIGPKGTPKNFLYTEEGLAKVTSLAEHESDDPNVVKPTEFKPLQYPTALDGKRVMVRYADDTPSGLDRDGSMEIRPGVADLSLGKNRYAQVRINVDDTHYLKGVAVYGDEKDFPPGVDIIFNTNKTSDVPKQKVFKELDPDPANPINPFGATIKANGGQSEYIGKDGKSHLSPINIVNEEGDWDNWSKSLSAQFLSKQPESLIRSQLKYTVEQQRAIYEEIKSIKNPTIRQYYMNDFADACETAAWEMHAAALPRQSTKLLLPAPTIGDDKVYAPTYNDGEKLALVRHPHAGTFEIPILTVDNSNPTAKKWFGNTQDAIGVSKATLDRLSGADTDGDTVICIPTHNGKVNIKSTDPLPGLIGFDPKTEYSGVSSIVKVRRKQEDGTYKMVEEEVWVNPRTGKRYKPLTEDNKQRQMGIVSNLISDMTQRGATVEGDAVATDEIARAVRHSMTVIDAKKHHLDYEQSYRDNRIKELIDKYQPPTEDPITGKVSGGASTLISMRKKETNIPETQGTGWVNMKGTSRYDPSKPEGVIIKATTGREYKDKDGKTVKAYSKAKLVTEVDDVMKLSSGTNVDNYYAAYANTMKALSRQARLEAAKIPSEKKLSSAEHVYAKEVADVKQRLRIAELNAPRERQAHIAVEAVMAAKRQAYKEATGKNMPLKDQTKLGTQYLNEYRKQYGSSSKYRKIVLSDKEWEAVENRAFSPTTLTKILKNCDTEAMKDRAMPKSSGTLAASQKMQIINMARNGKYTYAEIAKQFGVSPSTIGRIIKEA